MTLPRLLKWLAGIFLALVLAMFLVASLFDWNLLRAPISRCRLFGHAADG